MKVLLITHRFLPAIGGVEIWADALARGLCSLGHEVTVLSRDERDASGAPYTWRDESRGPYLVRWVRHLYADERGFRESWHNPRMDRALAAAMDDLEPDLVHIAHNDGFGVSPFRAAEARGVPVVVTLHDYKWICARGQMVRPGGDRCESVAEEICVRCVDRELGATAARPLLRSLLAASGVVGERTMERDNLRVVENRPDPGRRARQAWTARQRGLLAALNGADRITAPSRFVAERHRASGLRGDVQVIPNGLGDPEPVEGTSELHFSSAPARREAGPLRVGAFGRPHPTKGLDSLITAFSSVPEGAAELHLFGASSEDVTSPSVPGLTLHGAYKPSEVSERMAQVDIVAIPSLWDENHPMVAVEALAARKPLLVSDRGGLPELIDAGSGWVLPAGNPEAWGEHLALLAADPARVQAVARELPPRRSGKMMASDFEALYAELVHETDAPISDANGLSFEPNGSTAAPS